MRIIFHCVRWKNFQSTGNAFIELKLDSGNRTLIVGKNGAGKSQFIDAIAFALFNQAFRDINKPDLINTINNKDCRVEVEFTVLGVDYKVVRGQKHSIFEVWKNGEILNKTSADDLQDYLEKQVLKMNFKTFKQVVVLGSTNYVPFMKLAPAQRREVNESLMDLQVFSVMGMLLKGKISQLKTNITSTQTALGFLEQQKKASEDFQRSASANNDEKIEAKRKELITFQNTLENHEGNQYLLDTKIKDLRLSMGSGDINVMRKRLDDLMAMMGSIAFRKTDAEQNKSFFETNSSCPMCGQEIDPEYKTTHVNKCLGVIEETEVGLERIGNAIEKTKRELETLNSHLREIEKIEAQKRHNDSMMNVLRSEIKRTENEIVALQEDKHTADLHDKIIALTAEIEAKNKAYLEDKTLLDHYETSQIMLKDEGIKATILAKYIPVINTQVNAYLAAMNFFVGFQMNETFDVAFTNRFRDKFKYEMFSEGQKARIDLALMLTWRDIAAMKNSVSTNLLVMDEILDSSLDAEGSEELLQIFDMLKDQTIIIISHRDLYHEKFDNVFRFSLEKNFSQLYTVK